MRSSLGALFVVLSVLLLAGASGCGALSAMANPKAAWALNEPAPMSVVVRRAEVAHTTALQVKRLLDDTGVDTKSAWIDKVALSRDDAKSLLEQAAADPVYRAAPMRIVPAEAWAQALPSICSSESGSPSLLSLLSPDVAEQYADVTGQDGGMAELKAALAAEQKALAAEGISAEERKQHSEQRAKLEKQISDAESEHDPKVKALLRQVRADAAKAAPAAKEKLGVVVPVLARAVEDAQAANAAAMIRYPLSMPGMTTDVQVSAKRFAADVIEERTGTRPSGDGIKPDIKLDGTDVKLTLNGVPAEKLGKLSMDDLIAETTKRTKAYVERVLGLTSSGGETQDLLSFESDLLEAIQAGLGGSTAAMSFSDILVQSDPNGAAPARKARAGVCGAASTAVAKGDKSQDAQNAKVAKTADTSGTLIEKPATEKGDKAVTATSKPAAPPVGSPAPAAAPDSAPRPPKSRAKVESADPAAPGPGGPDLRLVPAGK